MERKFSLTLSGGAQTTVSFVKGLEELTDALSSYQDNVFCVFDENSARLLSSIPEKSIVLPSGEVNKNIGSLEKIIGKALSCGSARDTRFIGFGGGVICDMAALASSLLSILGIPLPLSASGFGWLIPSVVFTVLGIMIDKKKAA